jgi:two-component system OmpR family sensor kinase
MLSFRRRLALIHLAVVVAIVACAAVAAWWTLSNSAHGQLDAALLSLAETEAEMLADSPDQQVRVHERPEGAGKPSLTRLDRLVQIVDEHGDVLAGSTNLDALRLPAPVDLLARLRAGEVVFETLPHLTEEPLRIVSVPAVVNGHLYGIQVAGSLDDVNRLLASAALLFGGMGVALLVAVWAAGAVLAGRVFRAIDDVVHQARSIGEASLDERLPHPGTADEIGQLVDTLNAMLDRLAHAFDLQRRFTADASHELRSPLSRLRTEIEVTLRRERDSREYVDTLRSCLEEVERLTLLVEELLMLARLDARQGGAPAEIVALAPLVEESLRRAGPAAHERQVSLVCEAPPLPVAARVAPGPASLVLANLVENAVKFSPGGTEVRVGWREEAGEAVLCVSDRGPGIPASELPHVFDRFYRGSGARAGEVSGMGLGLALSQAIVQAYGGRISAANAEGGGARFTVRLPLAA